VEIIRLTAIFVFSFVMLWLIDPYFALICVALTGFIGAQGFFFFRFEKKVWEAHEEEADKLNKLAQENITGIRVVQSFASEAAEIEKFDQQNRAKLAVGIRHIRLHTTFWPISDLLVLFQIVLSILFGGWYAMEGTITLGELLTAYTYLVMVSWPMRQLGRMLSQTGMAMVAFQRLTQILDTSPEGYQEGETHGLIEGDIVFQDVTFTYDPNSAEPVLKNVSFHIRKGEKVALIGPTSAGKTTVINLLTRLYEPQSGTILIDAKPISTFTRPYLRANIGVVLQKPFLFSTSVAGNIAYARPEASNTAIREAAHAAQAHTIEEALPQGFETVVGEKGVTLSGGQKQRVALARTLLQQPDILVLDDITSAVDTQTEKAIFEGLQHLLQQKTTIIISHRVSSIMQADRVLVLDNGEIVAEGTPDQLARQPGYYQEILALQADLNKDILSSIFPGDA
jgi:ATP-binding cassette subfamily B protein